MIGRGRSCEGDERWSGCAMSCGSRGSVGAVGGLVGVRCPTPAYGSQAQQADDDGYRLLYAVDAQGANQRKQHQKESFMGRSSPTMQSVKKLQKY